MERFLIGASPTWIPKSTQMWQVADDIVQAKQKRTRFVEYYTSGLIWEIDSELLEIVLISGDPFSSAASILALYFTLSGYDPVYYGESKDVETTGCVEATAPHGGVYRTIRHQPHPRGKLSDRRPRKRSSRGRRKSRSDKPAPAA